MLTMHIGKHLYTWRMNNDKAGLDGGWKKERQKWRYLAETLVMFLINRILNSELLTSSHYEVEIIMPLTAKKGKLRALPKIIHHLTWYSFPPVL